MEIISNKQFLEDTYLLPSMSPLVFGQKFLNNRKISFLTDTCPRADVVYLTWKLQRSHENELKRYAEALKGNRD